MNRILFEPGEIRDGVVTFGGERADHVLDILHGEVGQILKTGVVNGMIGTSEITAIDRAAGVRTVTVRVSHDAEALGPWVDLILAPPRPRVMKRLLPQLAALGVGRIILVGAEKVEKDFWGATLLREENYRPLLVDGLMQSGTTALPTVEVWKSFRRFLREGLPTCANTRRLVAHPYGGEERLRLKVEVEESGGGVLVSHEHYGEDGEGISRTARDPRADRLLLAVGPEGGWTDEEVAKLEATGFARYSLGPRILRTDTATVALLARLM